jgi:alanyl-tRNA synthetase
MVKIVKTEKRGGETRVHFRCGKRALRDYQLKQDIVSGLVRLYRMSEGEVLAKAEATAAQLRDTQKELAELVDKALLAEAREIVGRATSKVIERTFDDKNFGDISALAKDIIDSGDFIVVMASTPDKRLLFAHGGKLDINCGRILKENLPSFNGKGGGKENWANGGFGTEDDMGRFKVFLLDMLVKKGL